MENQIQTAHSISIENRLRTVVTAVVEVISATEKMVNLKLDDGAMQITGSNLHINKLNIEEKLLILDGTIIELKYLNTIQGKSFFKRIFK